MHEKPSDCLIYFQFDTENGVFALSRHDKLFRPGRLFPHTRCSEACRFPPTKRSGEEEQERVIDAALLISSLAPQL